VSDDEEGLLGAGGRGGVRSGGEDEGGESAAQRVKPKETQILKAK
jgi:hypothetical protein